MPGIAAQELQIGHFANKATRVLYLS